MSKGKKKTEEEVIVEETLEILTYPEATERYEHYFNQLYERYPTEVSKAASRKERQENNYSSTSLTYGETSFGAFTQV
jgi:hypothetical protein